MAETSSRILKLLSLLQARVEWRGSDLAQRLGVSDRTLRRDIDTLRELDYPIEAIKGPGGGYRLGSGSKLPPLVLDDDQAIAIALALQTAPASIAGIDDSLARALHTLRQVMPARVKAAADDMLVHPLRNYWEFSAPPIEADTLRTVGSAIRTRQILRFDYALAGGRVPHPSERDFAPPHRVEPHHLVVWAGRWYLVAHDTSSLDWGVYRVERIRPRLPLGPSFTRRALPEAGLTDLVTTTPDRGDLPADWACVGEATLDLPPDVVARWAPGGSVVTALPDGRSRMVLGGWSWAGVAGLYATFDTDLHDVEPVELQQALHAISTRFKP